MASLRPLLILILVALAAGTACAQDTPLRVLTVEYPPYVHLGADGTIEGESTAKVRALLDAAGVAYEIRFTPWARAVVLAQHEAGTLIYPLTRTPERETNYLWLLPIATVEFRLMGHRHTVRRGLNHSEITSGRYSALCEVGTIQCDLLAAYGFPNKAIIRTSGTGPEGLVNMIVHERGEFLIADPKVIDWHLAHMQEAWHGQVVTTDDTPMRVTDYLAASPKTDLAILARIDAELARRAAAANR